MLQFDRSSIIYLKEYLYQSSVHDARCEAIRYDNAAKTLAIDAVNPVNRTRMRFYFQNVKIMISISGDWIGSKETISSITVENDDVYVQNCSKFCNCDITDYLCLVIQMFSGDELHVIAGELFVE